MISVTTARRRAEEFAALVDAGTAGREPHDNELLALAMSLRSIESPSPRPEFVASLREQLMLEADTVLVSLEERLSLPKHTRTRSDRRVAIAAGAIALVGATSSMAVAAQSALPGDALYPIKRALENVQTTLEVDDTARATDLLSNAAGRLDEASALAQSDDAATQTALSGTLDDFIGQANSAADIMLSEYAATGDTDIISALRAFASRSMDQLAALDAIVPSALRDELTRAALALTRIDERAAAACPVCAGGITQIPTMFLTAAASESGNGTRVAPAVVLKPVTDTLDTLLPTVIETLEDASGLEPVPGDEQNEVVTDPPAATVTESATQPLEGLTDALVGDTDTTTGDPGLLGSLLNPLLGDGGLLGG